MSGAPEIQPMPIKVVAGQATAVAPAVGQMTLTWRGAKGAVWQVLDESKRTTLRTRSVDAGQSDSLDIGPGNYFVVMSGAPEIQPMPIKVVAGQATAVAPAVGQMTLTWRGAKGAVWQVLDESKRTTLRTRSVDAGQSDSLDIGPGNYFVVMSGAPEIQPMPIKVVAGQAAVGSHPPLGK